MEPLDLYSKIQPLVLNEIRQFSDDRKYDVAQIPAHTHTGTDANNIDFADITNITRFILHRIVANNVATATGTVIGGDLAMPFNGYITLVGATVDTAGTTNATTIDIKKNGTSILLTKITVDSGTKTSRSAVTSPSLNTSNVNFITGDILTFNVDTVSTTPANGLTVFINISQT